VAGIDLTPIKNFVEGEMVDTIEVLRDVDGYRTDELNRFTGEMVPGAAQGTIYNGKGLIIQVSPDPSDEPEGGGEAGYTRYTMMLPLQCPVLQRFDKVILVNCVRDPLLNGTTFDVHTVDTGTFQAVRTAQIQKRTFSGNA
jgi:hypothetical protein